MPQLWESCATDQKKFSLKKTKRKDVEVYKGGVFYVHPKVVMKQGYFGVDKKIKSPITATVSLKHGAREVPINHLIEMAKTLWLWGKC